MDLYADFAKGTTGVRALQMIDIAVRHAESFAAMQDAIAKPRKGRACGAGLPGGTAEPLGFRFMP